LFNASDDEVGQGDLFCHRWQNDVKYWEIILKRTTFNKFPMLLIPLDPHNDFY
jgi:hypothetical protein